MDEISELLINKVQNHPCVYDDQHTEYKSLNAKEQAWKNIGDELKLSPLKAKARWKNLRDSYVKYKNQLNKVKDAASQEAVNNRFVKWNGRTNLSFLDEILARRSQPSSVHVPFKTEHKAIKPTLKYAKSLPYDKIAKAAAKQVQLNSSVRAKRKSQSKQRRSLHSNTSPNRRAEKTYKKEIQQTGDNTLSDVFGRNASSSETSHLEVSTTNGIANSVVGAASRDYNVHTNQTKPNDANYFVHYLEDKKKYPNVVAVGGGVGEGAAGVDAIDHLFSSYAQTFRTLPLRQQVNIKVEMAKLFAIAEIESQQ
ncbi:uncharacterized protein [Eurosta solidaginis]|uniref:uncharacterized protein n=1 Tax=Eurosta solidaginis TaxID=178769 RepID=UPI003530AF13